MNNLIKLFVLAGSATLLISQSTFAELAADQNNQKLRYESKVKSLLDEAQKKRDEYLEIWKNELIKRRGMTKEYFDEHYIITKYYVDNISNCVIRFQVHYDYSFGWITLKNYFLNFLTSCILVI